jgi:DNA polymerase
MDNTTVIPEMIQEGVSSKIIQTESGGYKVVIRPSMISHALEDKLSPEDISLGMNAVIRQMKFSNILTGLYGQCCDVNCAFKEKCIFKALPNGITNADVMFINKMPTDYEMAIMTSHSDKVGAFLSMILKKMNISRDSVYCTDMIKCNAQLDEQSYHECINTYLKNEIEHVAPKVIVCNGLSVLKACIKTGILKNLPVDVTYGKIYDANTVSDTPVKVIAIYDLNTVLQKTGEDYNKCKTELWTQILSAFKASV